MNPLLMAWETTVEDVENVLLAMGADITLAPELLGTLDCVAVAKAALNGTEMEQQTEYAYAEIRSQLTGKR